MSILSIDGTPIRPVRPAHEILMEYGEQALDGTLTDAGRVEILGLAVTMAAAELYRIENGNHGTVELAVLQLIHHLMLLCKRGVTLEELAQLPEEKPDEPIES